MGCHKRLGFEATEGNIVGSLLGPSIELLVGSINGPGMMDGSVSIARFGQFSPTAVAVDTQGDIYVADTRNSAIRMVSLSGMLGTFKIFSQHGHQTLNGQIEGFFRFTKDCLF